MHAHITLQIGLLCQLAGDCGSLAHVIWGFHSQKSETNALGYYQIIIIRKTNKHLDIVKMRADPAKKRTHVKWNWLIDEDIIVKPSRVWVEETEKENT